MGNKFDLTIRISGEAGQGIQTISDLLSLVLNRLGYYIIVTNSVESRIRGGHSFFTFRITDFKTYASRSNFQVLIALSQYSLDFNSKLIDPNGVVIYDSSQLKYNGSNGIGYPIKDLIKKENLPSIVENSVSAGIIFGLLKGDLAELKELIYKSIKKMKEENWKAIELGYKAVTPEYSSKFNFQLKRVGEPKLNITGNEAIALGSIAAGLSFYSGYPMTPSTGILEYLVKKSDELPIAVIQAESEDAAINMACGAAFTGARSMVGTSGGGFCLMVEGLGWAAMSETPIVMVLVSRPGPSTGMPTRTEQSDLHFAINASHGEFPRFVFAPFHPLDAFYLMERAFNLADKYQVPVIIMSDKYLGMSNYSIDDLDASKVKIIRPKRPSQEDLKNGYKRYQITEDGISPLLWPGESDHLVHVSGDEHDAQTWYAEEAETRIKMANKRFAKLKYMEQEIQSPEIYGKLPADYIFVTWGSCFYPCVEATDDLTKEGYSVAVMGFRDILPFPKSQFLDLVEKAGSKAKFIAVEQNVTGQLAELISAKTCFDIPYRILKYDGREFTVDDIIIRFKKEVAK